MQQLNDKYTKWLHILHFINYKANREEYLFVHLYLIDIPYDYVGKCKIGWYLYV